MQITRRAVVIAAIVGLEVFIGIACLFWDPFNAGIVERGGIIYEVPRTDEPAEYNTRYFERAEFEAASGARKRVLTYWFHAPGRVTPGEKYPLVMVLHGRPGRAYAAEHLVTTDMERDFPAYVMIPTAPESKAWAVPDRKDSPYAEFLGRQSLPDAVDILRRFIESRPVDLDRIYVIGCSEGGFGAYGAVLRYPDVFAAAVAISGYWDVDDASKMTKVPLWIVHGSKDSFLPVSTVRSLYTGIKDHGGNVRYTEIADLDHYCPASKLYPREMWEWMFSHRKSN
ncbi:MAG: prolyl oligopeptidase family serine peptidase [Alphaproteobacteria bacterium]